MLRAYKIDYFSMFGKYGCLRQFSNFFTNNDNVRSRKYMSVVLINEIEDAETKTKTEVIYKYIFSFDQFI